MTWLWHHDAGRNVYRGREIKFYPFALPVLKKEGMVRREKCHKPLEHNWTLKPVTDLLPHKQNVVYRKTLSSSFYCPERYLNLGLSNILATWICNTGFSNCSAITASSSSADIAVHILTWQLHHFAVPPSLKKHAYHLKVSRFRRKM